MKILALFRNQEQTSAVVDALNSQKTLRNEVDVEVMETMTQSEPKLAGQIPNVAPVAPAGNGNAVPAMRVLAQPEKTFTDFDLSEAERGFIERSVQDGGHLMQLNTQALYQPQVETILQQHDAQIIRPASHS